jgi:ankyrin repeat protein
VNARDNALETPLIEALHTPNAEAVITALLAAGASPDIADAQGRTAVHHAGDGCVTPEILAGIWRASENPEAPDLQGRTPFLYACRYGADDAVGVLLSEGANLFATDPNGDTALHLAALWPDKPQADGRALELMKRGGDILVNAVNGARQTPLHTAIRARNAPLVSAMIKAGASLNVSDNGGITPLCDAISMNDDAIVKLLMDAGADIQKSTQPLVWLAVQQHGWTNIVAPLLDEGADIDARDEEGRTALMKCAWRNDPETATLLLDKGANASLVDNQARGILHYVHTRTAAALVQRYIAGGAKINAKDNQGRTPLHHAVLMYGYGPPHLVDILLKAGADPTIADKFGTTPWDIAHLHSTPSIIEVFRKKFAKSGKTYKPKYPKGPH